MATSNSATGADATDINPINNDFERARVMFPDYLGPARGKYLPSHLAPTGTGHCVTLYGLGCDRSMVPAPGSYLLEGLIDLHATMDPAAVSPAGRIVEPPLRWPTWRCTADRSPTRPARC